MSKYDYGQTFEMLRSIGQEQLLGYYGELDAADGEELLRQINETDLSIASLAQRRAEISAGHSKASARIEPLGALTVDQIEARREELEEAGLKALREGKVAAALLAGGQGTRLGISGPKGAFNIGVTRELYIFECLINNMLDNVKRCGRFFHLFIMTSEANDAATREFLKAHCYFGYDPDMVHFFKQDMAPSVGFDGKVLLESKGRLALSPNGNGGWFNSLERAGYLDLLKREGVEWLSFFAVDNVLQRVNDPAFIGATILSGAECGAKVVRKNAPDERIGVICLEDGRPSIVEYYEATPEMQNARDEKGDFLYSFGVMFNYLYSVDALERVSRDPLPYHIVEKKIPCLGQDGEPISPKEANGLKFERLSTDLLQRTNSCLPYEIVREREFAPVKNMVGVDSVESARKLLMLNGVEL